MRQRMVCIHRIRIYTIHALDKEMWLNGFECVCVCEAHITRLFFFCIGKGIRGSIGMLRHTAPVNGENGLRCSTQLIP